MLNVSVLWVRKGLPHFIKFVNINIKIRNMKREIGHFRENFTAKELCDVASWSKNINKLKKNFEKFAYKISIPILIFKMCALVTAKELLKG